MRSPDSINYLSGGEVLARGCYPYKAEVETLIKEGRFLNSLSFGEAVTWTESY